MEKKKTLTTTDKLVLIAGYAKEQPRLRFTSLIHLLNEDYLRECHRLLKRGKAPGIDGRTVESYSQEEINQVIEAVGVQLKQRTYRPQPVRRVYIESGNKKNRPLGIPTVIDKVVQLGATRILQAIYESAFLTVSYGYRSGTNAHEAVTAVNHMIMGKKVNWIIDCDIEGFFDHIDHTVLMRCLDERIADPNFKILIKRIVKTGVMEEGQYYQTREGAPQGGIVSPILANIYLHYILDLWFEKRMKKDLLGHAQLIRYADDFVIGVQHRYEAEKIRRKLEQRLKEFGLTLSQEKTQVIEFGRFAQENVRQRGERKPKTFDFVGFTHYCTTTRDGRFQVRVKTSRKRMNKAIHAMQEWVKQERNRKPLKEIWAMVKQKLTGHYQYYGVSGNFDNINRYYWKTEAIIFKWMNRRSQKKTWTMEGFNRYMITYPLPRPKVTYAFYNTW